MHGNSHFVQLQTEKLETGKNMYLMKGCCLVFIYSANNQNVSADKKY